MRESNDQNNKNTSRSAAKLACMAVLMFGFAFALVPLYDVFCDITGINGKTDDVAAQESNQVDFSRTVTVEFVAYINPGLGWDFVPEMKRISVHPGETHTIAYRATNNTLTDSIGQAVPSVSPGLAAQYLNKIECFCFNRQPLAAGKDAELPLVFYVDPAIPDDINTLTLAYTLFSAKTESVTQ